MRSKLFVPGSRPDLFAKALASDADAISVDLEDSVAEDRKAEARANVREFLASVTTDKVLIVRVNAVGTPHFEEDLRAVKGAAMVNLPKVESPAHIPNIETDVLANIETPKGLRHAAEIAAHPKVVGLQLGLADLFGPFGITRDAANLHSVLFAVRMAAAEAGVFAYDSAYPDIKNPDGFRAEAEVAFRLGYLGKSCIHPSQIAVANDIFRPSDEDIAHALRVVEAAREQTGAFTVDGKMIDAPYIRRAERILAARRT